MLKELNKFIEGTTNTTDVFSITDESLRKIDPSEVEAIQRKLNLCKMSGLSNVDHIPGAILVTMTEKAINRGPQTGLEGDVRVSDSAPQPNIFRPRYRKLSLSEAEHHDAIKNKAGELLDLIGTIPGIRAAAGQFNSPEEYDNILRSRVHLEDAVYRAVKALTA